MKKVFLLFLSLTTFSAYAQLVPKQVNANVKVTTEEKQSYSQKANERTQAQAAQGQARAAQAQAGAAQAQAAAAITIAEAARSAAMGSSSTEILVPITVDLNNYTHIALVSVNGLYGRSKDVYNWAASVLLESNFVVLNPTDERRSFKKNPLYLRDTKNPNWLYVYYTRSEVGVNELRDLIVRDWKNQIIYSSKNVNIPSNYVFQPLINF